MNEKAKNLRCTFVCNALGYRFMQLAAKRMGNEGHIHLARAISLLWRLATHSVSQRGSQDTVRQSRKRKVSSKVSSTLSISLLIEPGKKKKCVVVRLCNQGSKPKSVIKKVSYFVKVCSSSWENKSVIAQAVMYGVSNQSGSQLAVETASWNPRKDRSTWLIAEQTARSCKSEGNEGLLHSPKTAALPSATPQETKLVSSDSLVATAATTTTSFDVCGRDYIFLLIAIAIFALSATVLVLLCHPNPNAKVCGASGRNKERTSGAGDARGACHRQALKQRDDIRRGPKLDTEVLFVTLYTTTFVRQYYLEHSPCFSQVSLLCFTIVHQAQKN
jgi:hypothetical protein